MSVALIAVDSAQATTAPTNSIVVHVELTSRGVKLTPPAGKPVAEAGFVTLFRVYNRSSSTRRFMTDDQSVAVKKGGNSGFYIYFPVVARYSWQSRATGGRAKNFRGDFVVRPCKELACREQG